MLALALLLLVGAVVNTDGRKPGSIPQLDVPPPPEYEDVDHPEFEPYPVEDGELLHGAILEQFTDGAENRWEVFSGDWEFETAFEFEGFANDKGLVLKSEQMSSAIARKINILDTTSGDKPFVVQYEVKTQQPLRCGGAYLKLLPPTSNDNSAPLVFDSESQYVLMFGPDRCGPVDKVHVILKDSDGVEHHLVNPPRMRSGLLSTLYTLEILPDQTFVVLINGDVMRAGSLLDAEEFDPPLVALREIDDPNDTKPEDWVDDEYIPDPEQLEKPEDWDEDAPYLIPDPDAVKPAGWHEEWPLYIPDPHATKPELWDDEEDGEWKAREILNPQCAKLDLDSGEEGCGEWLAPLIRNPDFRGEWQQPYVPNPEYKGEWKPQKIANPEFDANATPNKLSNDIGAVGFELLTVQGNLFFDNVYIGHSVIDAENIGNATWSPKYVIELESQGRAADAHRRQMDEMAEKKAAELTFQSSGSGLWQDYKDEYAIFKVNKIAYIADAYNDFISLFRVSKLRAIRAFPVTFVVVLAVTTLITSLVFGLFNALVFLVSGKKTPADPSAKAEAKEKAEESEESTSEEESKE